MFKGKGGNRRMSDKKFVTIFNPPYQSTFHIEAGT